MSRSYKMKIQKALSLIFHAKEIIMLGVVL